MLIFIFSSCGIPSVLYLKNSVEDDFNYYNFETAQTNTNEYTTTLKLKLKNSEQKVVQTPSICYFYAIYPNNFGLTEINYSTKLVNEFNDIYYENKYPGKRLNISGSDPYVLNLESSNNYLKLYKFTYNNNDQEALSYLATIDDNLTNNDTDFTYDKEYVIKMKVNYDSVNGEIKFNETSDVPNLQTLLNSNLINSTNLTLKRYNINDFINSAIESNDLDYLFTDDSYESDATKSYKIIIFAAITIEGNFSNVFWSELHKVGSFEIV